MRRFLARVWEGWKRVAARIGHVQSRLILSAVYFVLVGPVALPFKLVADPLRLKRGGRAGYWVRREPAAADLDEARRQ